MKIRCVLILLLICLLCFAGCTNMRADKAVSELALFFKKLPAQQPDKAYHRDFDVGAFELFEGGLLICGRFLIDSGTCAELYYFRDGEVRAKTIGSDVLSMIYTVFKVRTIVYGMVPRVAERNCQTKPESAYRIRCEFADGTVCETVLNNGRGGYIFTAPRETWVKNMEFYDKDGSLLENQRGDSICPPMFQHGKIPPWRYWAGFISMRWSQQY